jgi:hypothetical protein
MVTWNHMDMELSYGLTSDRTIVEPHVKPFGRWLLRRLQMADTPVNPLNQRL